MVLDGQLPSCSPTTFKRVPLRAAMRTCSRDTKVETLIESGLLNDQRFVLACQAIAKSEPSLGRKYSCS